MKSAGWKFGFFALLITISVFLGIEIASSGIERVQGPIQPPAHAAAVQQAQPAAAEAKPPKTPAPPAADPAVAAGTHRDTGLINRLTIELGDGLRYLARGAIRFVAAVFSAVIH